MPVTRPYLPRILIAFDFDRTLATDSVDAILDIYDISRPDWERDFEQALGNGWDEILRRGKALIDLGRDRDQPLSRQVIGRAAGVVRLYDGVRDMPERVRRVAQEIHPEIEVEFVVLSSGFAEIIRAAEIDGLFDRTFASAFAFDADGLAVGMKRIIGHPEKALYLEALGKNVEIEGANAPEAAVRKVEEHDRRLPFDQMIYLGDGASDLHAFGFMKRSGGLAIAVAKNDEFDSAKQQLPSQRVDNLAPPDYSRGGKLMTSLEHAVRACASRIALRAVGHME